MPANRPRVSVLVPARDAAATLPDLLAALDRQTVASGVLETIVVDDGSRDATAALARRAGGVELVDAGARRGIAAARNLGVRAASAEVFAFVDADCHPEPTWIERGLASVRRLEADIVAGHIEVTIDRPSPVALLDLVHYFDQERYASEGFGATGNLWVRREVFERVGLFDERLVRGSDREFVARAVEAGFRLRHGPDVVVAHPARGCRQQVRRAFAVGKQRGLHGLAERARHGAYVSPERIGARLERAGYRPTAALLLAIRVLKNVCIRAPMAAGAIWGGFSRQPRRSTSDAAAVRSGTSTTRG